jgi:hypothetical protein
LFEFENAFDLNLNFEFKFKYEEKNLQNLFHFSAQLTLHSTHCLWQHSQSFDFIFISFPNQPRWLLSPHGPIPIVSFLWPSHVTTLHLRSCRRTALPPAILPHPLRSHDMTLQTYHLPGSPFPLLSISLSN